MSVILVWN